MTSLKILLAGGTGVVGRATLPLLTGAGHAVTAVSRRDDTDRWVAANGGVPVRLDLFDADAVRRAAAGADVVVNLATHIPAGSAAMRTAAWATNDRLRSEAAAALATAAIHHGARFVQESFAPAYPDRGADWIDEDVPLDPVHQTASVATAEASAGDVAAAGLASVVLRFGLFYHASSGMTLDMLAAARRGWLQLPGPGSAHTSMVHVDDAAIAVVTALTAPAGCYNVVEDHPVTRDDHCAVLADLLGRRRVRPLPRVVGRMPTLVAMARSHRISNARLRSATDWRPRFPDVRAGWTQVIEQVADDARTGQARAASRTGGDA